MKRLEREAAPAGFFAKPVEQQNERKAAGNPSGDQPEYTAKLFSRGDIGIATRKPFAQGSSQFLCWWARIGLPPRSWVALEIRDRVSGRMRADAVVIPTLSEQRYVVSMFGTISDWVHNLEAAHGEAVIAHGGSQRVRLVPVAPEERAPILQEYARVASSGGEHFPLLVGAPLSDFAATAAQYPLYIGVERTSVWRRTRPIIDPSLEHSPERSSRSRRSVASITAMSGAPRRRPARPPAPRAPRAAPRGWGPRVSASMPRSAEVAPHEACRTWRNWTPSTTSASLVR